MRQQDGLARPARLVDVELATDDVGAQLGHPAERRGLAAGDRDEALEAVGLLVVERLERPRQLAAAVALAARADERAGRRPRRPRSACRTAGISFAPSAYIRST